MYCTLHTLFVSLSRFFRGGGRGGGLITFDDDDAFVFILFMIFF